MYIKNVRRSRSGKVSHDNLEVSKTIGGVKRNNVGNGGENVVISLTNISNDWIFERNSCSC